MPGRHANTSDYRYGFNGKENDNEIKGEGLQIDYGFRIYDPRLGKFLSEDPLTASYPHYTPYQFAGNNPVRFIDLDGLEEADHGSNWSISDWLENIFGFTSISETVSNSGTQEGRERNERNHQRQKQVAIYNAALQKHKQTALEVADYVLPVELANQVITGKNLDGTEATPGQVAFNVATIIPLAKVAKGGKVLVKHGDTFLDITDNVTKFLKKHKPCGCFTAGTKVYTEDGYKNIEEVKTGDLVWSFDDKTEKLELKKVVNTFTRDFEQIFEIYFGDEILEVTHEHPFFIGGRWLKVDELKVGDFLTLYDGSKKKIDKIDLKEGHFKVFNFTVEDFHTYYVSGSNVLVHNGNPCDIIAERLARKGRGVLDDDLLDNVKLDGFFEIDKSNALFSILDIDNKGVKGALRSVTDLLEKSAKQADSDQATIIFQTVLDKKLKDPKIGKEIANKLGFDFKVIEGTSGTNVIWTKIMKMKK